MENLQKPAVFITKSRASYLTGLFLLLLMAIAFCIRTVPVYAVIFTNWPGLFGNYVNFAPDDAIYHMRLVHNTLAHYPWRIFFDPFTHFPAGGHVHFGPAFTLIIATLSLIVGLGHPSYHLVDIVGAYVPAIMGALCVLPVYFIAKNLYGRIAGIFAALILTFLPGEFLHRSMLGFTDNHVAEVLFAATTIAFLLYALQLGKAVAQNFSQLRQNKLLLSYAVGAGFFLGLYILVWSSAITLVFILCLFFILQILIDHYQNCVMDYLVLIVTIMFGIALLMILPTCLNYPAIQFAQPGAVLTQIYYSLIQPLVLILAVLGIWGSYYISTGLRKQGYDRVWVFPAALILVAGIGLLLIFLIWPQVIQFFTAGGRIFTHTDPRLKTIAELGSSVINMRTGQLSFDGLWAEFFWVLPITLVGIAVIYHRVFKYNKITELLFLIWTAVMIVGVIIHRRFTYYFAVNAAVISGYVFYLLFDICFTKFYQEKIKNQINSFRQFFSFIKSNQAAVLGLVVFIILTFCTITYPWSTLGPFGWTTLNFKQLAGRTSTMPHFWYEGLVWLREHTPDPQGKVVSPDFSYADGYYKIPDNAAEKYTYPSSAYGVMSWWDYGHDITVVAQRIANANPYQMGILENNNTEGAAPFFVTTDEAAAVKNLLDQGSRYVLIDNEMATTKFGAISVWAGVNLGEWNAKATVTVNTPQGPSAPINIMMDSDRYHQTMMSRLYYNDASGLSHFRLIYEVSGSYILTVKTFNFAIGREDFFVNSAGNNFDSLYKTYLNSRAPGWANADQNVLAFDARPPVKPLKIYEMVKGARIIGHAPNGVKVKLSLKLRTLEGRYFMYTQEQIAANGSYQFVVPYPTEAMHGEDYNYDVLPVGQYQLQIGRREISVAVPETAVLNGLQVGYEL